MDKIDLMYCAGIAVGYLLAYFLITLERQIRHLTYVDGYKEGLEMAIKIRKSVSQDNKRRK